MYTPNHFKETDLESTKTFMRENDFATLVTYDGSAPVATHLLVEVLEDGERLAINGHIARANGQWKTFEPGREALVIFSGPHTYISPRWYNQVSVPTWNYISVHAYGVPQIVTDPAELRGILHRLVERYEAGSGANPPYSVDTLPEGYMEKHMQGVVGLKIAVTRLEAKAKLSQNRNEAEYANVVHELEQRSDENSRQVAAAMRKKKRKPADNAEKL